MPSDHATVTPLDALWQPSVILWAIMAGEGLALLLTIAPGATEDHWSYFGLASLCIQWVLLLSLGTLYALRHPLSRVRPLLIACLAIALLAVFTWGALGAAWLLLGNDWGMSTGAWRATLLSCTGIAVTVGLLGLAAFHNHWRARQLAVRAKQAELEALQARIRPHFLFNTLNTGAALVHQRPEETERLLLDLSDLFRAALAGPREITLADELALVRRYLEIEGLRFGDRLRVEWQVPVALPDLAVPALSIQPLVENAIRHGVEPVATGGDVHLQVATNGDWLEVTVANALPSAPVRPTTGHQVGLNAVRARIQAMTHGRGSVRTTTAEGRYTAVIRIPLTP
ncbi:histidine kinase [Pseudoxanthomonas mexicana]|uniref:Histidine kinase n=1 Tax=Pseudoxanthomonas mexicana TaxID=128785 RepID=A0A7G9TI39_PSEMX|nr:histidine kinase [Pseudoxanthomonas mexicana]QNN79764.1 histidine kinase [Pseudoxanthomonas mexicana]